MNGYCKACGAVVEVKTQKLMGGMMEVVCAKFFHFIDVEPDYQKQF